MERQHSGFWAELGRIEGWGVGKCLRCGYSLRHLPDNCCPECGRRFDPGDARTMDMRPDGPRELRRRDASLLRRLVARIKRDRKEATDGHR